MNVTVESPFPRGELPRAYTWHKYTTTCINGRSFTLGEYLQGMSEVIASPGARSWGVYTSSTLSGMVVFEPIYRQGELVDGSIHIVLSRGVWGRGVIEAVASDILRDLFTSIPSLLRVSGFTPAHYRPGLAVAERLGFIREGSIISATRINGVVRDIVLTGLTRVQWETTQGVN